MSTNLPGVCHYGTFLGFESDKLARARAMSSAGGVGWFLGSKRFQIESVGGSLYLRPGTGFAWGGATPAIQAIENDSQYRPCSRARAHATWVRDRAGGLPLA